VTPAVLAIVLFAGLAVGMTGIGGLLVVPALTALAGMPVARAVPATTLAFLFTGIAATLHLQWRRRASGGVGAVASGSPDGQGLVALQASALIGAGAGAMTLTLLPSVGVQLALALLSLLSGLQTLAGRVPPDDASRHLSVAAQVGIGFAVGIGSAWSGTGGPILLLPILMWLAMPTRSAIAMAQAVQLPIALSATAVNLWAGQLDIALGITLGALLIVGWAAGVWVATRMHTARLRQALGWLLIGIGLWYGLHNLQS